MRISFLSLTLVSVIDYSLLVLALIDAYFGIIYNHVCHSCKLSTKRMVALI